jgi:hypothetical protein
MKQRLHTFLRKKAKMTDEHASALLNNAISKQYAKGDFLLTQGQVCIHYFFVETGLPFPIIGIPPVALAANRNKPEHAAGRRYIRNRIINSPFPAWLHV